MVEFGDVFRHRRKTSLLNASPKSLWRTWGRLCNHMETTVHRLINGDSRDLSFLSDASVHLVVTSPPYWNLKRYQENPDQLGHIQDYEAFLKELEKVWRHVFRVLIPGGRLVCVVGDVCVDRRD